jgi:hypothetical protein
MQALPSFSGDLSVFWCIERYQGLPVYVPVLNQSFSDESLSLYEFSWAIFTD